MYSSLGGPQRRFGGVQKALPPPGFDPLTVQPVVCGYTDYVVPVLPYSQGGKEYPTYSKQKQGYLSCKTHY
jgi:hypothetical protein